MPACGPFEPIPVESLFRVPLLSLPFPSTLSGDLPQGAPALREIEEPGLCFLFLLLSFLTGKEGKLRRISSISLAFYIFPEFRPPFLSSLTLP